MYNETRNDLKQMELTLDRSINQVYFAKSVSDAVGKELTKCDAFAIDKVIDRLKKLKRIHKKV